MKKDENHLSLRKKKKKNNEKKEEGRSSPLNKYDQSAGRPVKNTFREDIREF